MSSSKFNINRLALLPQKKILDSCPTFVIEFIAKSLGIKYNYDDMFWKKDETKIKALIDTIESTLDDEDICLDDINTHLRDIALFVNPESSVQWKSKISLLTAFWSVHNFSPKIPLKSEEVFGYKNEENIYAIDPAMTYQIALYYKINTNRETTLENIQAEIVNFSCRLTPIRYSIFTKLSRMSRKGLIDLKTRFFNENNEIDNNSFSTYSYPETNESAIESAARDYRWDISGSNCPIAEYMELDRVSDDKYIPIDTKWGKLFNINKHYFHLDFRYNSKFDHLYSDNVKRGLVYRNGGSEQSDYLTFGIHPLFKNIDESLELKTSLYHEPINLDWIERYKTLLGSPDFIVSRKELAEYWESKDAFLAPHDLSKEFSEHHLRMIKVNCESDDPLRITIENIRSKRRLNMDKALYYCLEKENSISILREILHLGLVIRGYTICYDEPPLSISVYEDSNLELIIEKTSLLALKILLEHEEFLGKIPLVTGRNILGNDIKTFVLKPYGENKTLKCIIEKIFDVDDIYSCIRTNSNYLLATSWYFLEQLESFPPFKLEDLVFIQ